MKVSDVMKGQPRTVGLAESVGTAGRTMAEVGCGVLPVIDGDGQVLGMITDRDICCALAGRDQLPSQVMVREVMSTPVVSCRPEVPIGEALATMRRHKVRRLPVVDDHNRLEGLLALDDVVLEAKLLETEHFTGPLYVEIAETLKQIVSHPTLAVRQPVGV